MIQALPNQPLGFSPSRLQGCLCPEPDECLLVDTTDIITAQFVYDPCVSDQLLANPNFESSSSWIGPSWTIGLGRACLEGVAPYSPLIETSFTPAFSSIYQVRMNFQDITGLTILAGLRVTFGGAINEVITAGTTSRIWTVQTFSPAPLLIASYLGGTGCVLTAEVYELTPNLLVEAMQDGVAVASMAWGISTMSHFVFEEDRVTISFDPNDLEDGGGPVTLNGCYTIRVTDTCDGYDGPIETQYESQCIKVDDFTDCTLTIKACNGSDAVGFIGDFEPTIRVRAKLVRPVYEYNIKEERLSNGKINRYYADRQSIWELRIDRTGEYGHAFISTLPLWDHLYIGTDEYVVEADGYEPAYADVYESYGGILLKVRPAEELARKVRCVEDDGGCSPPPNYLVQDTGPNTNYVLQSTTGERILIH